MVLSGWSAEQVLFQPYQYRLWDYGVIGERFALRDKWLRAVASGAFPNDPWQMEPLLKIGSQEYWDQVWQIASDAYYGRPPPAGCQRVTHYDNRIFWGGKDPPWAERMLFACCKEDHCFWTPADQRRLDILGSVDYSWRSLELQHRILVDGIH